MLDIGDKHERWLLQACIPYHLDKLVTREPNAMIKYNSRDDTCEFITTKDVVIGGIQLISSAYRLQAASIVGKLSRRPFHVRHSTVSQHLNLLCSSSHTLRSIQYFLRTLEAIG
jgi:hypothetical protein